MTKKKKAGSKTNSTSGLNSTDICEIIAACKEGGVSEINYRDMSIRFDLEKDPLTISSTNNVNVALQNEIEDNIVDEPIEEDLALTDPMAYEELILGEIDE